MREIKTVVFLSNFFNHHQQPFSETVYNRIGVGYQFIETEKMTEERRNMGWEIENLPEYVITVEQYNYKKEMYQDLIDEADVVIIGSAPNELVEHRIRSKKIVFHYLERPFKSKEEKWKIPIRMFTWRRIYPQNRKHCLLCASAYTSRDFAMFGLFRDRCYKWGYFTELRKYEDIEKVIDAKKRNSILWVARFIDWKHPEVAIQVAKRLKTAGYQFELNIIGDGILKKSIEEQVRSENVEDCVHILGSMKPVQVRSYMEMSEVFLFTSDRNEGWGAVLNEAMNSACAIVASHAIGGVPFLIRNHENGLIYKDGEVNDIYLKTKWLLDNTHKRKCWQRMHISLYNSNGIQRMLQHVF